MDWWLKQFSNGIPKTKQNKKNQTVWKVKKVQNIIHTIPNLSARFSFFACGKKKDNSDCENLLVSVVLQCDTDSITIIKQINRSGRNGKGTDLDIACTSWSHVC